MGTSATLETRKKDPASFMLSRGVESSLRPAPFKETNGTQSSVAEAMREEPNFNYDFSRIPTQGVSSHHQALQPESQSCSLVLSDSRTYPFGGACHICPARVQTKLAISQPGDEYEQEADRVAEEVVNGSAAGISTSKAPGTTVMRQAAGKSGGEKEEEKYKDAAKKTGEAFLETDLGKKLTDQAKEKGEEFITSIPGMVITGAAAAGAVGYLAATNKELPIGLPDLPLDKLHPGLKMKITYEGPVLSPTKAMIMFSGTFGGPKEEKKPGMTKTEMEKAKTAKMATEMAAFQEMLKTPEQKKAEEEALAKFTAEKFGPKLPGTKAMAPAVPPLTLTTPTLEYKKKSYKLLEKELKLDLPGIEIKPEEETEKKKKHKEKSLQRKAQNRTKCDTVAGAVPPIVHEVLQSPGQPLDTEARAFFEPRFGYDFGCVRIHAESKANEAAHSINARAFTVGKDIVFAKSELAPTESGRMLLAHELAHSIQHDTAFPPLLTRRTFGEMEFAATRQAAKERAKEAEIQPAKAGMEHSTETSLALSINRQGGEGTTFLSTDVITLSVQTLGMPAAARVSWTVHGVSPNSGNGNPHSAENQNEFSFRPTASSRPKTASRKANDPIIYDVEARAGGLTACLHLIQDETDCIRQEYVDFDVTPPERKAIGPTDYERFNGGNYFLIVDNGLGSTWNAIQDEFEALTEKAAKNLRTRTGRTPTTVPEIFVESGFRNPRRNLAAGSRFPATSPHVRGKALDVVLSSPNPTLWARLTQAGVKAGCVAICEDGPDVKPCDDPGVDHVHFEWTVPPATRIEFEEGIVLGEFPRTGPVSVEETTGLTRRHKELMARPQIPSEPIEEFDEFSFLRMEWERMTSPDGKSAYLSEYKDRWVRSHRHIIRAAAKVYGLPAWVLAGVAWTEVGGEPPWTDDLSYILGDLGIRGNPEGASYGPVAIEIRRAAEELGYNPKTLWSVQMSFIIHSLRTPQENLYIVASHLFRCKNMESPGKTEEMLTDYDIRLIGARYNRGVEIRLESLLTKGKKTQYGDDLIKKKDRMIKLLAD